jgi:hypothetical protein
VVTKWIGGGHKYATRRKGWGGDIGPGMAGARMRGGIQYREVACGPAEGEKMCYQVGPAQLDCYFFFFLNSFKLDGVCFASKVVFLSSKN